VRQADVHVDIDAELVWAHNRRRPDCCAAWRADDSKQLSKVGLCAGSGGDLVSAALSQGADAFVTGEMRHHDALAAAAKGLTVICTLHSNRCKAAPLAAPVV
jgi:putative NIF3 family GTP cyclohydrolase 1 type 2